MRIGMLIAGFLILANPVIYLIDFLPDVIGMALIVLGLTKVSYLVGKLEQARALYQKLIIVEAVNLFSFAIVAMSPGNEKPTMALLLAFAFGVLELIFFIPATVYLFDGLTDSGIGYSGSSLFASKLVTRSVRDPQSGKIVKIKKEKSLITGTRNFVIFFYILRVCGSVLPELSALDDGVIRSGGVYLYDFRKLFYRLSLLLVTIFAVVFIVKIVRFFVAVGKDKEFIASINEKFEREVKPRVTLFISKRMKLVLVLFGLSLVTLVFRDLEFINYGTSTLGCLFLCAAAVLMARYNKLAYAVIPFSLINCGLTYYNLGFSFKYFEEHKEIEAIYWVEDANKMYYDMAVLRLVEFAFAAAASVIMLIVLIKVAKEHISLCGIRSETAQYSKANRDAETYRFVKSRLIAAAVFAVICMIVGGAYHYIAISTQAAGALYVLASAIYIAYTVYSLNALDDRIYDSELAIA